MQRKYPIKASIATVTLSLAAGTFLLTGCPEGTLGITNFVPAGSGSPSPEPTGSAQDPDTAQDPGKDSDPAKEPSPLGELLLQHAQMPPDTWQVAAPMVHGRGGVSAGTMDGKIFALGGDSEATVEFYDPARDAWRLSYLPPASSAGGRARHFGAAVAAHGRIFYIGGTTNSVQDRLDLYNPQTHLWLDASNRVLSHPRFQRTAFAAVANDGLITLIGGMLGATGASAPTDDVVAFNPDVTTGYSENYDLAKLPAPRAGLGAAMIDHHLYVVGGYGDLPTTGSAEATSSMLRYRTNAWSELSLADTPLAPLNTPRHSFGSAVLDGKCIVAGGMDSSGNVLDTVEAYDPQTNTWTFKAPMPRARVHLALTPLNGRLFALGGFDQAGRPLRAVDVFRP